MLKPLWKEEKRKKKELPVQGILFTTGGVKVTAGQVRTSQSENRPPAAPLLAMELPEET